MDKLIKFVNDRLVELDVKVSVGDYYISVGPISSDWKLRYSFGIIGGYEFGYRIVSVNGVDVVIDLNNPEFDPMDIVWFLYLIHIHNRRR
jgi:hypothetical protein